MELIRVERLVKDFGDDRGVFDISFEAEQGEVYGFLGPNGAGKTTTVRHLLGFSRPDSGRCSIFGLDCWRTPKEIHRRLGYVPGEIAFPQNLTGYEFLEQLSDLRRMTSLDKARSLIRFFDLDARVELRRMSKGMKQKVALVAAFMHDPELVVLDEPTSGLDPLMQARFVELIQQEQSRGKTIFLSSHLFDEVEKTCGRVTIIKQGKLIAQVRMKDLENNQTKTFEIKVSTPGELDTLLAAGFAARSVQREKLRVFLTLHDEEINRLIQVLSGLTVVYLKEEKYNLEQYFMEYYEKGGSAHAK